MSATPPRVLVISQDRLDGQIAGTSIRALELARVLRRSATVTLAGVGTPPAEIDGIPCVGYTPQHPDALRPLLEVTDVAVALPHWPRLMRLLRSSSARVVFDLYVPQPLEIMSGFPGLRPRIGDTLTEFATDRIVEALRDGDFLLCATEKQRDLYLGILLAERLIDGARYRADPTLRSLIDVVPFGLADDDAAPTGSAGILGAFPQFSADDDLVLWNGGVWPWLDPETAVRAVARLAEQRPRIRLIFMGAATQVPAQRTAARARAVAEQLGVLGEHVVFHDGWVPYDERADWLLDARCALYAHHDHLETRFAFRTRLLDCFWARLPVVCSAGDELADEIERRDAGRSFAPEDVDGCADALDRVLSRPREEFAPALALLADRYRWTTVAAPLERFVTATGTQPSRRRRTIRPGHLARHHGYRLGRAALDAVGKRDWPNL